VMCLGMLGVCQRVRTAGVWPVRPRHMRDTQVAVAVASQHIAGTSRMGSLV
jgi:hypothetical protein